MQWCFHALYQLVNSIGQNEGVLDFDQCYPVQCDGQHYSLEEEKIKHGTHEKRSVNSLAILNEELTALTLNKKDKKVMNTNDQIKQEEN